MARLSSVISKVSEGNGGVRLVTDWKVLMLSWFVLKGIRKTMK
jgi:hypothetical protein